MQPGQGRDLSCATSGRTGGSETVTLLRVRDAAATRMSSGARVGRHLRRQSGRHALSPRPTPATAYSSTVGLADDGAAGPGPAGGSLPHNNMQPYLTLNFCIAMQGVFPARP